MARLPQRNESALAGLTTAEVEAGDQTASTLASSGDCNCAPVLVLSKPAVPLILLLGNKVARRSVVLNLVGSPRADPIL